MRLDLSEIVSEVGRKYRYEVNEEPIDDLASGVACIAKICGEITFSNVSAVIVMRGEISTALSLTCSRCLAPYEYDVKINVNEQLPLAERAPAGADREFEEIPEDEREPLFEDNIFDLTEYLRQLILLALPMRPVCKNDCMGLCPVCGCDRNKQNCKCKSDLTQNPFAGLKSLFKDNDSE